MSKQWSIPDWEKEANRLANLIRKEVNLAQKANDAGDQVKRLQHRAAAQAATQKFTAHLYVAPKGAKAPPIPKS